MLLRPKWLCGAIHSLVCLFSAVDEEDTNFLLTHCFVLVSTLLSLSKFDLLFFFPNFVELETWILISDFSFPTYI